PRSSGRSGRRATAQTRPLLLRPKGGRRGAAAWSRLERGERFLRRLRNGEERVQLGELEQRLEILVEAGEPEVPALLADLLRQRNQDAEPGRVDVARLGEVDDEF